MKPNHYLGLHGESETSVHDVSQPLKPESCRRDVWKMWNKEAKLQQEGWREPRWTNENRCRQFPMHQIRHLQLPPVSTMRLSSWPWHTPPTPSNHPCYFHCDGCHSSFTCQSCSGIWWLWVWGNTGTKRMIAGKGNNPSTDYYLHDGSRSLDCDIYRTIYSPSWQSVLTSILSAG